MAENTRLLVSSGTAALGKFRIEEFFSGAFSASKRAAGQWAAGAAGAAPGSADCDGEFTAAPAGNSTFLACTGAPGTASAEATGAWTAATEGAETVAGAEAAALAGATAVAGTAWAAVAGTSVFGGKFLARYLTRISTSSCGKRAPRSIMVCTVSTQSSVDLWPGSSSSAGGSPGNIPWRSAFRLLRAAPRF